MAVRASDLLQANGLIWVEGPSDRILINHWIKLWSDGQLKEGTHYQCVFYGGALLAHHSGQQPADDEEISEFVELLRVNKNAFVVADSDRKSAEDELRPRVQKLADEEADSNFKLWITKGREIENYLSLSTLKKFLGDDSIRGPKQSRWADVPGYLSKKRGRAYEKVTDARRMRDYISIDDIRKRLDLAEKLDDLCTEIKGWQAGIPSQ